METSSFDLDLNDGVSAKVIVGGIQEIILKKDGKTLSLSKDEISLEVKEDISNFLDGTVTEIKNCSEHLTTLMNEKFDELSEADKRCLNYLSLYFQFKEGTNKQLDTRGQSYVTYCFFADSINEIEQLYYSFIDAKLAIIKFETLEGEPFGSGNKICEIRLAPTITDINEVNKYKLRFRASFYREKISG